MFQESCRLCAVAEQSRLAVGQIYAFMSTLAVSSEVECTAPQAFPDFDIDAYTPLQRSPCKHISWLLFLLVSYTNVSARTAAQWRAAAPQVKLYCKAPKRMRKRKPISSASCLCSRCGIGFRQVVTTRCLSAASACYAGRCGELCSLVHGRRKLRHAGSYVGLVDNVGLASL